MTQFSEQHHLGAAKHALADHSVAPEMANQLAEVGNKVVTAKQIETPLVTVQRTPGMHTERLTSRSGSFSLGA